MCGTSTSSPQRGPDQARPIRGILKPKAPTAGEAIGLKKHFAEKQRGSHKSGRVRFELHEPDPAGHDGPRRVAGGHDLQNTLEGSNRSERGAHTQVHDASLSQDSTTGVLPSRTVTRYDANSPEAAVDCAIDQMNPKIPERDSTAVGAGIDVFVSHRWDKPNPSKRIKFARDLTNVSVLGKVYATSDGEASSGHQQQEAAEDSDRDEFVPEKYSQAAQDPRWRASMESELRALKNRGCWRQVRIPTGGVRLIKSKFVYKIKKDWRGHVTKRKSRLVVQGFLQQPGVDFNETYAPVAKAATF